MRSIFTPEELAELAAFDAEIDDEDEPEELSLEDWRQAMRRDRGLFDPPKLYTPEQRKIQRERSREYRRKHPEKNRENCKQWYARNRDYACAYQREYRRTHPEGRKKTAENRREALKGNPEAVELRELRMALGLRQRDVGAILGVSATAVCYWETFRASVKCGVLDVLRKMKTEETRREYE